MPNVFPEQIFESRIGGWTADIEKGAISVDDVVNFVESKGYQLTTIQMGRLNAMNTNK